MRNILFLATSVSGVLAAGACPFIGPAFPAPKLLSMNAEFKTSLANLESIIEQAFSSSGTSHGPINANDTYSIQIFSTRDRDPLLDFHHRGLDVIGNETIDGDSIYRVASVTKLLTVYLILLQTGDGIFDDLVTKHVPEFAGIAHWEGVTVGAVAGYVSGITAEGRSDQHAAPRLVT